METKSTAQGNHRAWVDDYETREGQDMDMSKFKAEGNSSDLKAKDFIGKNLKLTIERVETVTYLASEKDPEQTRPVLYFVGKEKRLVLNGTNVKILCVAYGDDGDNWIDHEIGLSTADYTAKGFGHGWVVTILDVKPETFDDDIPF